MAWRNILKALVPALALVAVTSVFSHNGDSFRILAGTGTPDLTGSWSVDAPVTAGPSAPGNSYCQVFLIQSGTTASGTIRCTTVIGVGTISGSVTPPNVVNISTTWGGYSVSWSGTINSPTNVTGTWSDTAGNSGTFTADKQPTQLTDGTDFSPGDGYCDVDGSPPFNCSLRALVQETNALAGTQTIAPPAGTYTLTVSGTGEDAAATGDLDITDDVTIMGAGADVTIVDGGGLDKVLEVHAGNTVDVSGITITGGSPPAADGGGGIKNFGTLTLTGVRVTGNTSIAGGGGILQFNATLTIIDSEISNNTSDTCCAAINNSSSVLTITNSTISGNETDGFAGGIRQVGASSTASLNNVTVTNNVSDADTNGTGASGGIENGGPTGSTITLKNSIVAGNTDNTGFGPDCSGDVDSTGYNLIGDSTGCTFNTTTGDQVGTGASPIDAKLGTLQDNGGTTETHRLPAVSPAIDAGNPATPGSGGGACEAADQLGAARPLDGNADTIERCDIGAYEAQGAGEVTCPNSDLPPPDAGCDEHRFAAELVVDIASVDLDCDATGDVAATRSAVADSDTNNLDEIEVEITFLSGFIDCPGPIYAGSSIPNEGVIEEQTDVNPGELDFPATGTFTLCIIADTYPYGILKNCPDSFAPASKQPLNLTCTVLSLESFVCEIVGASIFYDETDTATATVESGDFGLVQAVAEDTDNDGCTNDRELLSKLQADQGGGRDPDNEWDFFDTPNPNPSAGQPFRDRLVDIGDILRVVLRFGASGDPTIPLLSAVPKSGYHTAYDRTTLGPNNWNLGPPDGLINIGDILRAVFQFGHNCQ